jgi:hypothetical protein
MDESPILRPGTTLCSREQARTWLQAKGLPGRDFEVDLFIQAGKPLRVTMIELLLMWGLDPWE